MIEFVGSACKTIDYIVTIVDEVHINSKRCKRLAVRLAALKPPLSRWQRATEGKGEDEVVLVMLTELASAVESSKMLIERYRDATWFKRTWSRAEFRDDFEDIYSRLDSYVQGLGLATPFAMHRTAEAIKEENEDEQQDWKELEDKVSASVCEEALRMSLHPESGSCSKEKALQRARRAQGASLVTEISRSSIVFPSSEVRLGRGSFGEVVKGEWEGIDVAVKRLVNVPAYREEDQKRFQEEIKLMAALDHPHIVHFYGAATEGDDPYLIVMEFMKHGSLADLIKNAGKSPPFDLPVALKVMCHVAQALAYIHANGVIHRDVKAANVLCRINSNGHMCAKLADFGLAKQKEDSQRSTRHTGKVGSILWMAPEVLDGEAPYNKKADIFSFAILCYEILTGKTPYEGKSEGQIMRFVVDKHGRPDLPSDLPDNLTTLVKACWDKDPVQRPTAGEVVKNLQTLIDGIEKETHQKEVGDLRSQTENLTRHSHRHSFNEGPEDAHSTTFSASFGFGGTSETFRSSQELVWPGSVASSTDSFALFQSLFLKPFPVLTRCTATLSDHTDNVSALALAPGGTLYSAADDNTVREWIGGRCNRVLAGHTERVMALAIAPDGTLYSGSGDATIRVWKDGQSEAILEGHTDAVTSLAIAPDGTLFSASYDGTVRQWRDQDCIKVLKGHRGWVLSLAISPHGTLYSAGRDCTVLMWRDGKCSFVLRGHTNWVTSLTVTRDGTLYSGSRDTTIRCWKKGECVDTLEGHTRRVATLAVSPDGTFVYSGSNDGTVRQWDRSLAGDNGCVAELRGHGGEVWALALASDGTLYSGSCDRTVRRWE